MPLIPYTNRSYQQIKEYVLTRLFGERDTNGQFVVGGGMLPEVTDHSENNILVRIVSVWAGIAEMLNYYIDNAAKETFLQTCRRYKSAVMIARFYDYQVKCSTAAATELLFYVDALAATDINILTDTQCVNVDGIIFRTTAAATIQAGQMSVLVSARQVAFSAWVQLGVSDGTANQEIELPSQTAYGSVSIRVNAINYKSKATFAFSKATDRHFVETVNATGTPIVRFGDGFFGVKPSTGAVIEIRYGVTEGGGGNVSANTIDAITPSIVGLNVINPNNATGGTGVENLTDLKRRIPLSNRTLMTAVRKQDYIDIAETYPSVAKAGAETACGAAIKIYIVPIGGGIASIQQCFEVFTYFEDKRLYGRMIEILPTGEVKVKMKIKIRVRADFSQETVFENVKERLKAWLSYQNQSIGGIVELSDAYEVIETTEGVINSRIQTMTTIPFARWAVNGSVWKTLDWTAETNQLSNATIQWQIKFVSIASFQLMRNGEYVGTYNVGNTVAYNEVSFTVNRNQSVGDVWHFTSYPYFGSIELQEMSLPAIYDEDIILEVL